MKSVATDALDSPRLRFAAEERIPRGDFNDALPMEVVLIN